MGQPRVLRWVYTTIIRPAILHGSLVRHKPWEIPTLQDTEKGVCERPNGGHKVDTDLSRAYWDSLLFGPWLSQRRLELPTGSGDGGSGSREVLEGTQQPFSAASWRAGVVNPSISEGTNISSNPTN